MDLGDLDFLLCLFDVDDADEAFVDDEDDDFLDELGLDLRLGLDFESFFTSFLILSFSDNATVKSSSSSPTSGATVLSAFFDAETFSFSEIARRVC